MANVLFGGFKPVDGLKHRARPYPIASGYGTALFRGDMVTLVAAGTVEAATAGDADLVLGVIKEIEFNQNGKRIRDSYYPASSTYSPTTLWPGNTRTSAVAYVYDDPNTEFWGCVASHANSDTLAEVLAARGANMDITASAGSTVYKQSGHVLDGTVTAGTAKRVRITEPRRIVGNDLTAANWQLRFQICEGFHVFHSSAGI